MPGKVMVCVSMLIGRRALSPSLIWRTSFPHIRGIQGRDRNLPRCIWDDLPPLNHLLPQKFVYHPGVYSQSLGGLGSRYGRRRRSGIVSAQVEFTSEGTYAVLFPWVARPRFQAQ